MTCLNHHPSWRYVCTIVHPDDMSVPSSVLTTCLYHHPSWRHVCTIIHPDDMSVPSSILMTCLYHCPSWWHVYAIVRPDDMSVPSSILITCPYHRPSRWHVPTIVRPDDMSVPSSVLMTCLYHRPSWWHVCTIVHPDDISVPSSVLMTCLYHRPFWWLHPARHFAPEGIKTGCCLCFRWKRVLQSGRRKEEGVEVRIFPGYCTWCFSCWPLVVVLLGWRVPGAGEMSTRLFLTLQIMTTLSTLILVWSCCSSWPVTKAEALVEWLWSWNECASCCSSLHHFRIRLKFLLMWVPDRWWILQQWADQALVALWVDCGWASFQANVNGDAGLVGFGGRCVDMFPPVEMFSQLNAKVFCAGHSLKDMIM